MPHPMDTALPRGPWRFRPAVVPTLAMLAAVALFVAAGRWQQGRMHDKEALRAQLDAAQRLPPAAIATLPGAADWPALRFRPVVAVGVYRATAQILIDNRVHDGRAGYDVVAPLELPDGRAVLVDRGWVAQGATRAQLPDVPPPGGTVTVEGRLALPAARYLELQRDAESGPVREHLDPARYAAATGIRVLPVVIEQTAAPQPDDGLVRDWPAPDFGSERHLIYMVQWYAFAALAVTLWIVLNVRRSTPRHG
jgi:surfeit locus 1 family protein